MVMKEFEMEIEKPEIPTFHITEDNLRQEAMRHPSDLLVWNLYMTRLRHRYEQANKDLARCEAELYEQARAELHIMDGKAPTEKRIASHVAADARYQAYEDACHRAKVWYDEAKCVVDALAAKTSMLKALNYANSKVGID